MAKYYTGSTVSRIIDPADRSWVQVVAQSGKIYLDSEVNLGQELTSQFGRILGDRSLPSGWLKGQSRLDSYADFAFGTTPNAFNMAKRVAYVAGYPIVVEYSNTTTAGTNVIELEDPPLFGGAPPDVKRTDFVFLEAWLALVSDSPNATGTITVSSLPTAGDTLTVNGTVLTAVAGAPAANQFQIGGSVTATASNIATSINTNVATVTASTGGTAIVTVRAVVSGTAGNAYTLATSVPLVLVLSGATLTGGTDMTNKPTQDKVYKHGNVLAPSSVCPSDDIADPSIGSETTKRVQLQYRIRVTGSAEAVNMHTQADGFTNTNILAQGTQSAGVAGYAFVRADKVSTSGSSSAVAYGMEDPGLWVAGSGDSTSATDLGTVDGFVYAIPICFVFRRNDAYDSGAGNGWDPLSNTNGALPMTHGIFANPIVGSIGANLSDRPDGLFCDKIVETDVLDLRRHVSPVGHDFAAELQWQMQSLLDKSYATWAIDASDKNTLGGGSGDVSTQFLVCNQIGRDAAHGGTAPTSGSTNRGDTIRSFDHVARRFADRPVVERVVFDFSPAYDQATYPGKYVTQANGGFSGWAEDDELHLDLSTLNASTIGDFDPATASLMASASVADFFPPGTTITDVLSAYHDDGNFTSAVSQIVEMKLVEGVGTDHLTITLDRNNRQVTGGISAAAHDMVGVTGSDVGSQRRIFLEVEVTYPLGGGLTDTPDYEVTPDATIYTRGPVLENDTTQRPDDWENLLEPRFREGYREVSVQYVANDGSGVSSGTPLSDSIVSRNTSTLVFPRRVYGSASAAVTVTDNPAAQAHDVLVSSTDYGSSTRLVTLDTSGGPATKQPLSGAQTLCDITYFAQDPLPNWGAAGAGYQIGVYYRSHAPQTVGVKAGALTQLPDPLVVEPLLMAQWLWTGISGKGAVDLPFPYTSPLDQIPVNDNGTGSFPAEWYFCGTSEISVDDFNANTGLLNLHTLVPVDGTTEFSFESKDTDPEFRAMYKVADTSVYRPTAFAQSLSGVARHKVFLPFLAKATEDTVLFRKGEVLLVVISRFGELDAENSITFTDTDNKTCAAIYRTRNLMLVVNS